MKIGKILNYRPKYNEKSKESAVFENNYQYQFQIIIFRNVRTLDRGMLRKNYRQGSFDETLNMTEESLKIKKEENIQCQTSKFNKFQIVWAKISGYPWWPAVVSGVPYQKDSSSSCESFKNKRLFSQIASINKQDYQVDFIAEQTSASLKKNCLLSYQANREKLMVQGLNFSKRKRRFFQMACNQADQIFQVLQISKHDDVDKLEATVQTVNEKKDNIDKIDTLTLEEQKNIKTINPYEVTQNIMTKQDNQDRDSLSKVLLEKVKKFKTPKIQRKSILDNIQNQPKICSLKKQNIVQRIVQEKVQTIVQPTFQDLLIKYRLDKIDQLYYTVNPSRELFNLVKINSIADCQKAKKENKLKTKRNQNKGQQSMIKNHSNLIKGLLKQKKLKTQLNQEKFTQSKMNLIIKLHQKQFSKRVYGFFKNIKQLNTISTIQKLEINKQLRLKVIKLSQAIFSIHSNKDKQSGSKKKTVTHNCSSNFGNSFKISLQKGIKLIELMSQKNWYSSITQQQFGEQVFLAVKGIKLFLEQKCQFNMNSHQEKVKMEAILNKHVTMQNQKTSFMTLQPQGHQENLDERNEM